MANIEEFKGFVKKNPKLIKYTKSGEMSWQKFYELYDLYGEDENTWKPYLRTAEVAAASTALRITSFADLMGLLKNVDLDSVQNGVSSIQRVLSVVQDLTGKEEKTEVKQEYKPRPLYKHFED